MNFFRQLLLGSGRLPDKVRSALAAEDIQLIEEGIPGSITFRHYRAPGRRSNWRREWFTGAVVVTGRRVLVWGRGGKHVDVPHDHPKRVALAVESDKPDEVCFSIRAEDFHPDRSGQVEVRLRTMRAEQIIALLTR